MRMNYRGRILRQLVRTHQQASAPTQVQGSSAREDQHVRMNFLNPVFCRGTNTTVREGIRHIHIGQELELFGTGGSAKVADGRVENVYYKRAGDITEADLTFEHDPAARTVLGLRTALRKAYGDDVNMDTIMTLVNFTIGWTQDCAEDRV